MEVTDGDERGGRAGEADRGVDFILWQFIFFLTYLCI